MEINVGGAYVPFSDMGFGRCIFQPRELRDLRGIANQSSDEKGHALLLFNTKVLFTTVPTGLLVLLLVGVSQNA